MHTARALRLRIAAERQSNFRVRREVRKVSALASMSKIGAVRSLTRLVAAWKRRSRDRPGFVHAEQRCTDAALMLDASTRVAAAARSGLIDLHVAFVVDHADGSHQRVSVEWPCFTEAIKKQSLCRRRVTILLNNC